MELILEKISGVIWGYPVLILMLGGGIYLSFRMGFPQIHFIKILRSTFFALLKKDKKSDNEQGGISQFQSFATSLAATAGTGSIVGVGTAIAIGGAGAVFWMWVSAFFGMALSYTENFLGVKYSQKSGFSGAMLYMEKGLDSKWLAILFAVFCTLASLGMGNMAQSNAISVSCKETFSIPLPVSGVIIAFLIAIIISGKDRLAKCTEKLVPFMALFYIIGSLVVIITHRSELLDAFYKIFDSAFCTESVAGGGAGFAIKQACIVGLKRGAFSNEAGLGSTVAVHASCRSKNAKTLGNWGMAEVFVDTIILCTVTALVILVSGVEIGDGGPEMICAAFSTGLGEFGSVFMAVSMILFAFATITGWFFIGQSAWSYIFPEKCMIYKLIFTICVFIGSVSSLSVVWSISDIFNGLMALPNLTAILLLSTNKSVKAD
ncbi:MAG: amino acid carrier protein [Ruminococcus sp.]|nr:amino acid carrier protein [Ruminococcus sp.]